MSEKKNIYPQGITCFAPKDNAPDFIFGDMIIDIDKLYEYAQGEGAEFTSEYQGRKQFKLQILKPYGDSKRPSVTINTWKPEPKADTPEADMTLPDPLF